MRRRFIVPSLATALVLSTTVLPASGQEADGAFTLTVLHSNDGESALLPEAFDFQGDEDLVGFACPEGAADPGFGDVQATNTHIAAIACGAAQGIINGTSATTFSPRQPLTRGQTATLLLGVLLEAGIEVPTADGAPDFSDAGATHGDAIRRLAAAEVLRGLPDGSFGTDVAVRRDQLATMMVQALGFALGDPIEPDGDNPFGDVPAGAVHAANITAAAELGLFRGVTADVFAPADLTSRDQAASVLMRLLGRVIGETVPSGGAARFVEFVQQLEADGTGEDAGVVTISSGDNFLAGPEYTASVESYEGGGDFYDALVYLEAGYDAMTIGNHEFDFGPAGLAQFVEAADPLPFLSANLDFSAEPDLQALVDAGRIAASTIVDVDGVQVGIIGATTEELASVSAPGADIVIGQVLPAVQAEVAALQADGVEHIILSSHLQDLNNERELIAELSGVDAVVGGGGAENLRDDYPFVVADADGDEVPLVTTPGSYRDVGKLVLEFDADGELVAVGDDSALLAVPPYGPQDETVLQQVETPVAEALEELANTPVAGSEVPLDARTATVRTRESNIANLLTDGMMRASADNAAEFGVEVADVALQNGGGIRGDAIMSEDQLSALFTFNTAPFGNRIATTTVDGAKLLELIEHGLAGLPGTAGQFGHWAGVEFRYDATLAAGDRVVSATVTRGDDDASNDVELVAAGDIVTEAADDEFTLVGLNFTLGGGDDYPFEEPFTELGLTDQQAFRTHLEAIGAVTDANYPDLTVDEDRYNRYGPVGGTFLP